MILVPDTISKHLSNGLHNLQAFILLVDYHNTIILKVNIETVSLLRSDIVFSHFCYMIDESLNKY